MPAGYKHPNRNNSTNQRVSSYPRFINLQISQLDESKDDSEIDHKSQGRMKCSEKIMFIGNDSVSAEESKRQKDSTPLGLKTPSDKHIIPNDATTDIEHNKQIETAEDLNWKFSQPKPHKLIE